MSGPFSFEELRDLLGGRNLADTACPACSPYRKPVNRRKAVLRSWRIDQRLISFYCIHCEASGTVWEDGRPGCIDPEKLAKAQHQREVLHAAAVANSRERARAIYRRVRPIIGTLGEVYFRERRHISCRLPATMGYLPGDERYPPAVVMPFWLAHEVGPSVLAIRTEAVLAVHLTRLAGDGSKIAEKPKIVVGQGARGFPIVVAPPNDLLGLVITEGIEDALSVHEATGLGAWAAGSKDRLVAMADAIPDWMDFIGVRPDDDPDGGGRKRAVELVQAIRRRMVSGPRGKLRPLHAELNEEAGG